MINLLNLAIVKASKKKVNGWYYYRYYEIFCYQLTGFETFVNLLYEGKVSVNLESYVFKSGYKKGKSYANRFLVMYVLENKTDQNRLGISVSKKVGNSVVRHRLTRLIRENYRLQEENFLCGYDIIVVVRVNARNSTFADMKSALIHLGRLHKIYKRM